MFMQGFDFDKAMLLPFIKTESVSRQEPFNSVMPLSDHLPMVHYLDSDRKLFPRYLPGITDKQQNSPVMFKNRSLGDFPQGAVIEANGRVICFVSGEACSHFLVSAPEHRTKREDAALPANCQKDYKVKYIDCDQLQVNGCRTTESGELAVGACFNSVLNQQCSIHFVNKGDGTGLAWYISNFGDIGTCQNSDGCGVISCDKPDTESTYNCIAYWGFEGTLPFHQAGSQPRGCINMDPGYQPGPIAGLTIGVVGGFAALVGTIFGIIFGYKKM